jgi:hypothetical protein
MEHGTTIKLLPPEIKLSNHIITGVDNITTYKQKTKDVLFLCKDFIQHKERDKETLDILHDILKERVRNSVKRIWVKIYQNYNRYLDLNKADADWADKLGIYNTVAAIYSEEEYAFKRLKYYDNLNDCLKSIFDKLKTKYLILTKI